MPSEAPVVPPLEQPLLATGQADRDGWVQPPAVTLSDGTRIRLHKDGEALKTAYTAIEQAKSRICLEVYIFRTDTTGRAFADLLARKARRGVRVLLIYDSFGSMGTDPAVFHKLARAGVSLRKFHPINPWDNKFGWRPLNRDHRKMLIIDDFAAGMGGLNIGAEYAGSSVIKTEKIQNWRDNAIEIVGPGANLLLHSFRRTWNYINSGGRIARAEFIHEIDRGDFGLLASVPTLKSPLRRFLTTLFQQAKKSIHLTMAYFAPDDALVEELCAAARRGVRVRLMLPGKSDVAVVQIAARSFYEILLNNGVQIFERRGAMLHAKTVTIDDQTTLIGSVNLDYRSIELNLELSAIIRNAEFGRQMRALFLNDMQHAERIVLSRWRYRPTWDRVVQWGVSRARYLM